MVQNYWIENANEPGKHVLVDLGYTIDAEENYNKLIQHISKSNFQRVGNDRLIARITPKKVDHVLAAVPEIMEGAQGYCWCTHGFVGKDGTRIP